MAEHGEGSTSEPVVEKLEELKEDTTSPDPDGERSEPSKPAEMKTRDFRLFGRKQPVHKVFGGGKPADVILWRNKKISAGVLGSVTAVWVLFELMEYHLLSLVAHVLIFAITIMFLYSNASAFINKSPPRIPDFSIPEDAIVNVALAIRNDINRALYTLREIAMGRDFKKFLAVIAGLWVLSVVGSCFNFLTLFYIVFVLLHTVPVLYEKYEDKIDAFAEEAMKEIKKQYAVLDAKVLSRIPRGPLKNKKQ